MRALKVIKNVLIGLIAILAVCMMIFTIVSVNTFNRTDRSIFGYRAFIVLSDSMSATDFQAGDLILTKEVDPTTLVPGDIISFYSTNMENYGEVTTHKIRELVADTAGNPGFITYGTTTGVDDESIVTYGDVLGKYTICLPGVGYFFNFLKTPMGYILCILLPFLILIFAQAANSVRLFRQYKAERMEEMETEYRKRKEDLARERRRLEEERLKSRKIMEELKKMKEALSEEKKE